MHMHGGVEPNLTADLAAAISDADAAFIMTDHAVYRGLSPEKLLKMKRRIVVDGRRMLHDRSFMDAGFTIIPVGAPVMSAKG
jgi:UDP-N-acetyl-D-mannosaminuronate dehydrogenase